MQWKRFASALVGFSLLAFLSSGCRHDEEKPDYSRPGSSGELPEDLQEGQRGFEYSVFTPISDPLVCSKEYKISATTRQQVFTCEGFNFAELYQRSKEILQARIAELQCPRECPHLQTWIRIQKWDCIEGLRQIKLAFASIQMGVRCSQEEQEPDGIEEPTAEELQQPGQEPGGILPFQDANELIVEEIGDFLQPACPSRDLVTVEWTKDGVDCDGIDFEPHVTEAVDRAQFHYNRFTCPDDCTKTPFQAIRKEWDCVEINPGLSRVVVKVYYLLGCKR